MTSCRSLGLQRLLHGLRDVVVLLPNDARIKNARGRSQRIDCGINSNPSQGAGKHSGRVQVSERRGRRGIGQVVGRNINGLHRSDGTFLGRSDALLQFTHFRGQVRLIAHRTGHAAEQRRDLRARLGETKNIVDEQQRICPFGIAEVFRDGQARQSHAQTRSRGLRHLTVDECGLGFRRLARLDYAGFSHFEPEIVAFARALADASKHRVATVLLGDVVDQFHDDDGLTHARATE